MEKPDTRGFEKPDTTLAYTVGSCSATSSAARPGTAPAVRCRIWKTTNAATIGSLHIMVRAVYEVEASTCSPTQAASTERAPHRKPWLAGACRKAAYRLIWSGPA